MDRSDTEDDGPKTERTIDRSSVGNSDRDVRDSNYTASAEYSRRAPECELPQQKHAECFAQQVERVINAISAGDYGAAISQLENDVLSKTDGCTSTGSPSGTDWITDCHSQGSVDAQILSIVSELEGLQ